MANKRNRKRNNRNKAKESSGTSPASQQGADAKPAAAAEESEAEEVTTPITNESEKEAPKEEQQEEKPAAPSTPAGLAANESILSAEERTLAALLLEAGQAHLFEGWEAAGTNDERKHAFFAQIATLHATYPYPGGLKAYLERARALLAESAQGGNPLEGWSPAVPEGEILQPGTARYLEMEALGQAELAATAFVLVAGGLGERLGYSGIKLALPTETTTNTSYIAHYLQYFTALQAKHKAPVHLAIMVSDDTRDRTAALLEEKGYFGFPREQLTLMKQEKVAALLDNDARIARAEGDAYAVECKPHGHGDVHSLLYSTGLAKQWLGMGKRWVVFFQDTNALAFLSLPAVLGVSQSLGLEVNSLAIPRKPQQAIGAITRLQHADGRVMIVNVEYNQLDPLLRASVSPDGDVADPATGDSPYPGNINQLLFKLEPYVATLEKTHGVMGEFVNPKYADAARTVFKKPTRLECMMQDYPKVLAKEAKVGFTSLPAWAAFSPVKNNAQDAAKAAKGGTPPGSAASGEADQYFACSEQLRLLGAHVETAPTVEYAGIPVSLGPRVVLSPSYALSFSELKAKLPSPDKVSISSSSTLVLKGAGIELESLTLDGALLLTVPEGTTVVIRDVVVKNKGHKVVPVPADEKDEVLRMRGYGIVAEEELRLTAPANAGRLVLTADLTLVPETEIEASKAAAASAIASPPAKPARPSSASSLSAVPPPAPAATATAAEEATAPAPSCWERAFGCFTKAR